MIPAQGGGRCLLPRGHDRNSVYRHTIFIMHLTIPSGQSCHYLRTSWFICSGSPSWMASNYSTMEFLYGHERSCRFRIQSPHPSGWLQTITPPFLNCTQISVDSPDLAPFRWICIPFTSPLREVQSRALDPSTEGP
jgi:hypothetical protein